MTPLLWLLALSGLWNVLLVALLILKDRYWKVQLEATNAAWNEAAKDMLDKYTPPSYPRRNRGLDPRSICLYDPSTFIVGGTSPAGGPGGVSQGGAGEAQTALPGEPSQTWPPVVAPRD